MIFVVSGAVVPLLLTICWCCCLYLWHRYAPRPPLAGVVGVLFFGVFCCGAREVRAVRREGLRKLC